MLGVLTYLFYLLSKPNIPSSQQACNKKLALQVWLAAVAPLNSGSHRPQKIERFFGDPAEALVSFCIECTAYNRLRVQNYTIFSDCANFLIIFAKIVPFQLIYADNVFSFLLKRMWKQMAAIASAKMNPIQIPAAPIFSGKAHNRPTDRPISM